MEAPPDGAADIVPLDRYDPARAKIAANLQWLCAKAYGRDNIPEDLQDPFYVDQYEQEHIKPPVIRLLLAGELYCRVCGLILQGDQAAALRGHQSVIQALSRKGIYVMESDDTPVTDPDLGQAPIKMSAHMAMVDALMAAYTVEMISIEKVVASVKRFSTFSASRELPYDLEDAMVFWVNKVNLKLREMAEKEVRLKQQLLESPAAQKSPSKWYWKLVPVRYRREHPASRQPPHFPLLEDLVRDGSDGAALLAVVHYYCPEQLKLDDVCLREAMSVAERLHNVRLLRDFADRHLNRCFYLALEDVLYAPRVLKPNVMVFIAELFWWFEVVKPDFVQPRDLQELKDAKPVAQPRGSRPPVPISNATRRSFLGAPSPSEPPAAPPPPEEPEHLAKAAAAVGTSHPLLPLRQKQQKAGQAEEPPDARHRSSSLSRVDGQPRGAALAWSEKRGRPASQPAPFALHHAASCEADPGSGDSISLARSISKDSLASSVLTLTPQSRPRALAQEADGASLLSHVDMEDEDEDEEPAAPGAGPDGQPDSFFLEPLLPAVLRPAKEKQAVTKEDECGEGRPRGFPPRRPGEGHAPPRRRVPGGQGGREPGRTCTPVACAAPPPGLEPPPPGPGPAPTAAGFFLHLAPPGAEDPEGPFLGRGSRLSPCSPEPEPWSPLRLAPELEAPGEDESAKLREDMQVREHEDKDDGSGRSSPCLSSASQASGASLAGGGRMTSFAERKLQRLGSGEARSSSSSSQKTTPDGSEGGPVALTTWRRRREQSPGGQREQARLLASELAQLHMRLEEKRRAIEAQKRRVEALSARQRLQLGKAAFLHVVRKGRPELGPPPLKAERLARAPLNGEAREGAETVLLPAAAGDEGPALLALEKGAALLEEGLGPAGAEAEAELSIEKLNETIGALQQAILRISQQQEQLLLAAPAPLPDPKAKAAPHAAEPPSPPGASRRAPRPGQGRNGRPGRPAELKVPRERGAPRGKTPTPGAAPGSPPEPAPAPAPRDELPEKGPLDSPRLHDADNQRARGPPGPAADPNILAEQAGLGDAPAEGPPRGKAGLIEVDLSGLKAPDEEVGPEAGEPAAELSGEGEPKPGLGFFFKDEQKAEDELAKKRAAFLLKQQRKAEEARLRKLQLEAEVELKRDEARRRAEEERARKEEERARRELIKQEYLRRKQQQMLEEQGLGKPKAKPRKPRPKSVHREEAAGDVAAKCPSTPDNLSRAQSGSSLSLASATTTEPESVHSGGAPAQRVESLEALPVLSRNASRSTDRDWETASAASSLASVAEYTGPRLFKEPSSKSNKPIIHNAIAHCCLAGKVNEPHKNSILEELERCDANHYIILFRDAGCQFRALYCYYPDSEEVCKLAGTGPRSITKKMMDKLYKYSSDRKQFSLIPAKTMSVSVDALTIHNHLWQPKRPAAPRKAQARK